ncbi:MAG: PHP domain-containing protein [Negativicutes bacterium]|nr:PHP domain-containing protein [Negativicutes bacterium]
MRRFVADLHVHSLLSPCAEVEMTPRNIIWHAVRCGIDIVAITDHNCGDNVQAALEAAKGSDVVVLPAMEAETKEEIHLIILFDKMRQLREWESIVQAHMSGRLNDPDKFGAQFVVDAEDNLVKVKEEMLLTSLTLSLEEVTEKVASLGGLCIASHVDKPVYSVISQLGFIPPGVKLAAVEISRRLSRQDAVRRFPALANWPIVTSSDAHTIEDFISGPKTVFYLEQPTLAEIRQAFRGENAREVVV